MIVLVCFATHIRCEPHESPNVSDTDRQKHAKDAALFVKLSYPIKEQQPPKASPAPQEVTARIARQ